MMESLVNPGNMLGDVGAMGIDVGVCAQITKCPAVRWSGIGLFDEAV